MSPEAGAAMFLACLGAGAVLGLLLAWSFARGARRVEAEE